MKPFLAHLNLSPQERRYLVLVLTVVLVVVNAAFVWPHFKDWSRLERELTDARKKLALYQAEVGRTNELQVRLENLEGQGSGVLPADQAVRLQRTVQDQALQYGVVMTTMRASAATTTSTNQFFDEQTVAVSVNTGEEELVNFLVGLGSGDSMIRVREIDLRPDPPQQKLNGNITLLASYQKKPKPAAPATPARPAKTVAASSKKS